MNKFAKIKKVSKRSAVVIGVLLVTVTVVSSAAFYATWRSIPRVDITSSQQTAPVLDQEQIVPQGVTSYLIASVGARGVSVDKGKDIGVPDIYKRGSDGLTDVILVALLNSNTGKVSLLSIPRDTWVTSCNCKINAILNQKGPAALLDHVADVVGFRPEHLILINFAAFADLIDSIGGIDLFVPKTIKDSYSHLPETLAGCNKLDGKTTLAYIRSRHTMTKLENQSWSYDSSGSDFGRITRQQQVIKAVIKKILRPDLPTKIPALLKVASTGLTLDQLFTTPQILSLAKNFARVAGDFGLQGFTVPATTARIGKASVVLIKQDQLPALIQKWRAVVELAPSQNLLNQSQLTLDLNDSNTVKINGLQTNQDSYTKESGNNC